MRPLPLLLALLLSPPALAGSFRGGDLRLDGEIVEVKWADGDSFSVESGPLRRTKARLLDVNTLESYGPVHRWGTWSRWELYGLSLESSTISASKTWECTSDARRDGYGRLLVRCPALAKELLRRGHAMVFAVDAPAPKDLLAVQREAQRRGAGMWKKGVPTAVVTGAHSVLEGKGYDRVVDTKTGAAAAVPHALAYETCEETCAGEGPAASCFVYVPFKRRYREPPPCLTDPRAPPRAARERRE